MAAQPGPSSLAASTPEAPPVKKPAKKRKSTAVGVEEEGEEGDEAKKKRIKTPRACEPNPAFSAASLYRQVLMLLLLYAGDGCRGKKIVSLPFYLGVSELTIARS